MERLLVSFIATLIAVGVIGGTLGAIALAAYAFGAVGATILVMVLFTWFICYILAGEMY